MKGKIATNLLLSMMSFLGVEFVDRRLLREARQLLRKRIESEIICLPMKPIEVAHENTRQNLSTQTGLIAKKDFDHHHITIINIA